MSWCNIIFCIRDSYIRSIIFNRKKIFSFLFKTVWAVSGSVGRLDYNLINGLLFLSLVIQDYWNLLLVEFFVGYTDSLTESRSLSSSSVIFPFLASLRIEQSFQKWPLFSQKIQNSGAFFYERVTLLSRSSIILGIFSVIFFLLVISKEICHWSERNLVLAYRSGLIDAIGQILIKKFLILSEMCEGFIIGIFLSMILRYVLSPDDV